jgi:pilus assembly protein Flp/PilA
MLHTKSIHDEGNTLRSQYLHLNRKLARLRDDRGATAVEYGLMVALIAIVIILAVAAVGSSINAIFNDAATSI